MSVAIIGGGMAGLTAAHRLVAEGIRVSVFDKARGPGGRMSRRRHEAEAGERHFDHGAQYFTVRSEAFARRVESWLTQGVCAPWEAVFASISRPGSITRSKPATVRYVGTPGMNAVVAHMADSLHAPGDVRFDVRVGRLEPACDRWRLTSDQGEDLGVYDGVILTVPAPQAAPLLADLPGLSARCATTAMQPCWAAMLAFERPLDTPIDAAFVNVPGGALSWIARNDSKPGRPDAPCWVAHASPRWSAEHLEADPEWVAPTLRAALAEALGLDELPPCDATAHRWRFAQVEAPLAEGCLMDEHAMVAVAGDWCAGARVEGAFASGLAAADRLLAAGRARVARTV